MIRGSYLCFVLFFFVSWPVFAGHDFAFFVETPLNRELGLSLDRGTGPLHGILLYQYTDRKHFGEGNQFRVGLNTDTVWLAWDWGATSGQDLVLSPYLKGQFGFAAMTPDFIRAGQLLNELSFFSLYSELGLDFRWRLFRSLFLTGNVSLRYWFFLHRGEAGANAGLVLPQNSPAVRSAFTLAWRGMNTWIARGRLKEGFQAEATVQVRRRFVQRSWGGFATSLRDRRNIVPYHQPTLRLLAKAEGSVCVHSRVCLGLALQGGTGWFADDLNRFRVGGDNDYIPMLSGTYFAEFVTDSYLLSNFRVVLLPWMWWRITPQVDVAWIADPLRTGASSEPGWILGLGLNLDFFIRDHMRIHVKLSYSPNAPRPERSGGYKLMVGYVAYWW